MNLNAKCSKGLSSVFANIFTDTFRVKKCVGYTISFPGNSKSNSNNRFLKYS